MKHMKRSSIRFFQILIQVFGLMGAGASFAAESTPADPVEAALNASIDQSWAHQTPGIQVGLWVPERGEWKITKGLSNIERNKPMRIGLQ